MKNFVSFIFLTLIGFQLSAQIVYTPEKDYFACDEDGDGIVSIPFADLQNYALEILEQFNDSPEIYITRAYRGISKITNLYSNPQIIDVCGTMGSNGGFYDIAINNQKEIFVARANGWLQKVDIDNCTLETVGQIHSNGQSVLALSFDHLNHLYEGGWSTQVYRAEAGDYQNFQLWHDFGEGRSAGDFVQIGNFLYVAWTMPNGRDYLYKVTLGVNNQYVSHENLGRIEGGTFGLAAEYGKLYGNTIDYLYEIDLNTMETTIITQRPDVFDSAGDWWGAAGFHEALDIQISIHNELAEAENGTNPLSDPFINSIPYLDWVYVRVHESTLNNTYIIPVKITVVVAPSAQDAKLLECKDPLSGLADFQLNEANSQINPDSNLEFSYFESWENLVNHENPLPSSISIANSQTVFVKVFTAGAENCYGTAKLNLIVPSADEVNYEENVAFCLGTSTVLEVPDEFVSYQWFGLQGDDLNQSLNTNQVTITQPGNYTLEVQDINGCVFELPFIAELGGSPEIVDVVNNGNSITVQVSPAGNYEYSLDGVFWQSSPTFHNIAVADYEIHVRDLVGCYSEPYPFTYFLVPNFISPNGDGKNDVWEIRGIEEYPDAKIKIFDRYGKIFAERKANMQRIVWDGKYLGRPVPSGTYWYIIELTEEKKLTGFITVRN